MSPFSQTYELFATCAPGLESILATEITDLAAQHPKVETGGVSISGDLADAAGLALWARTPSRILVRVGRFRSGSLQDLHAKAKKLPWEQFVHPGQNIVVKTTLHGSKLKRSDHAGAKLELAIKDSLKKPRRGGGGRHAGKLAPIEVILRVYKTEVTISVDASGPLHKRGWREASARAPLRENLAASVLIASDWQPNEPLADPMCGSGTFGIEGALMALDAAPGKYNTPPVVGFPSFQARLWQKLQQEAQESISTSDLGDVWIRSGDRDAGAIKAARQNATRAGVEALISYRLGPLETPLENIPEDGLVVVNPPWGHRIADNKKLSGLYLGLGKGLANSFPGWRVAVVCPDKALAGRLGKGMEQVAKFTAGGIKVGAWLGEIPS